MRLARARVRHGLKSRTIDIREALDEPAVQTMPVVDLLACLPGRRKPRRSQRLDRAEALARRIAKEAWIRSETVTIADLSPARRDRIAEVAWQTVPAYAPPSEEARAA